MDHEYYKNKSVHYGMGRTRLNRILNLAGDVKGKTILDVGCAGGRLGSILKEGGAVHVAGADISEDAANEAREKLDDVRVFDIGKDWPDFGRKFDIIILSEVLEHVFDPVKVLESAKNVLTDDGFIIITTPNFMTWTNRARFLVGDFKYRDQGMFDFGHIRWFTYSYLKKVLDDSNLKIDMERHILFPGKLSFIIKYIPGLFAFQFVLTAKRK